MMASWILLLGSLYITYILCYDIYKEYKLEHKLSPLRWIAVGVCLYYMVRSFLDVL